MGSSKMSAETFLRLVWGLVAIGPLLIYRANSMIVEGTIDTSKDWVFLSRFCFYSELGEFAYEFEYPEEYETQNLLLYYDAEHQWDAVYNSDKDCQEREAVLNVLDTEKNQIINLTDASPVPSYCDLFPLGAGSNLDDPYRGSTAYWFCDKSMGFSTYRERWWYIALSNCQTNKGLRLRYKMTMTNGDSLWFKHYSADQFYILQTDITFFVLYLLILGVTLYFTSVLESKKLLHKTYKLFLVAIIFENLSLIFSIWYYADYGLYGNADKSLETLSQFCYSINYLVFLAMLLLLAKGYTITRARISHAGSIKLTVFLICYVVAYATCFIYALKVIDPGEVLYFYESGGGIAICCFQVVGWVWFFYGIIISVKHYPEKKAFYLPFFAVFSFWFLLVPFMIILASYIMDAWYRAKVINGIQLGIMFLAHLIFLILTRPTAANKNFPFHVRTSQIGVMVAPPVGSVGGGEGGIHPDNFPHYSSNNQHITSAFFEEDSPHDEHKPPNFSVLFTVSQDGQAQIKNGRDTEMNGFKK